MRAVPDEPIEEMFVIARYVGITGDQLRRLLGVMSLCAIKLINDQPAAPAPVDGLVERLLKYSGEDVVRTLNLLTKNGELRDYDDELANRIEDAKDLVKAAREAAAALQSRDEPEPFGWYFNTGSRKTSGYIHGAERPDERAGWIPLYATPPRKP